MRADNPAHGVQRFADNKRDRRLSDQEYAALGDALRQDTKGREDKPEAIWPPAIAMTRFLLLTGWRTGEAAALRWSEIDLARRTATLSDTKSGRSMRPLVACGVRRTAGAAARDRRSGISGVARRPGDDPALQENLAAHRQAGGAAR